MRAPDDPAVRVEGVSLWVYVDPDSLRPAPLDARFHAVYGPATGGRAVSSRLQHPPAPGGAAGEVDERWSWPLRATDIDPFGHVNNAAVWAVIEELLARDGELPPAPLRAELEHRAAIDAGSEVVVEVARLVGERRLWVRDAGAGTALVTARLVARPG